MPEAPPLTISQLIDLLQAYQARHGDLPVFHEYDGSNSTMTPDNIEAIDPAHHLSDWPEHPVKTPYLLIV